MSARLIASRSCYAIVIAIYLGVVTAALAETPKADLLWPDGAPLAKGTADADKPTLTVYLPAKDKATGTAVVICPGGGYGGLVIEREGHQIAKWLNSLGVAGCVLKYRNRGTGYGHPAPLLDAQRAIRTVRFRAKTWGINPDRIGIIGFSAGGHLASSAGTHFDKGQADAKDPIDRVSCRPDFMILVYPVISFIEPYSHIGSRDNLLGKNPDPKLIEGFSNERQVTPETPPAFLVHAEDDTVVPVENSIAFYLALKKAKVPAEMHLYPVGQHGFHLAKKGDPVLDWQARCAEWMRATGLYDKR